MHIFYIYFKCPRLSDKVRKNFSVSLTAKSALITKVGAPTVTLQIMYVSRNSGRFT